MSSQAKRKTGTKVKRSTTFEKEPWYAAAAQRLSAARPNLTKDSPSLSPADDKQARENA
jgi:hypothetical protein